MSGTRRSVSIFCLMVIGLLVICPVATAQELDLCEVVPIAPCARILKAISTWNELFGESVKVIGWRDVLDCKMYDVSTEIGAFGKGENVWIPEADVQTNTVRAVPFSNIPQDLIAEWDDIWPNQVESFIGMSSHKVTLDWGNGDTSFVTHAYLSESYPYVFDSMLSNIVIEQRSQTCIRHIVTWIWGDARGEIFVDVSPYYTGASKKCQPIASAFMNAGRAELETGPVTYDGYTCKFPYAYGWSTPFAKISFDVKKFSFEVSGIGSTGKGKGECIGGLP